MPLVDLPTGETIWYKSTGAGPRVLQIHGTAFGHRNFERITPLLAQHCEVIDFDLPGYGESRGAPARDMAGIAEQVYGFMQAADLGRVHLHGTSFGAMVGLSLAVAHPEVIDHLIFSCFLARYDNAARLMRATWKRCARDSGMEAVADLTSVPGSAAPITTGRRPKRSWSRCGTRSAGPRRKPSSPARRRSSGPTSAR